MKNTILTTTLALSLSASTALAESTAPAMQMDEQLIVKQMEHETIPGAENTAIIVFIMLVILAASGAAAGGGDTQVQQILSVTPS